VQKVRSQEIATALAAGKVVKLIVERHLEIKKKILNNFLKIL
jgi:hypothetical protein